MIFAADQSDPADLRSPVGRNRFFPSSAPGQRATSLAVIFRLEEITTRSCLLASWISPSSSYIVDQDPRIRLGLAGFSDGLETGSAPGARVDHHDVGSFLFEGEAYELHCCLGLGVDAPAILSFQNDLDPGLTMGWSSATSILSPVFSCAGFRLGPVAALPSKMTGSSDQM